MSTREKPILMSAPMVRAILAGTKTQTRRIVKPQPKHWTHYLQEMWGTSPPPNPVQFGEKYLWREVGPDYPDAASDDRRCPYGIPGDRLWVREAHQLPQCIGCDVGLASLGGCICRSRDHVGYRATSEHAHIKGWKPGIHMPRWASRITLEVTGVRVERLQDISEEDAKAEGVRVCDAATAKQDTFDAASTTPYRAAFASLWHEINGSESWDANPWVWVVSFKQVQP